MPNRFYYSQVENYDDDIHYIREVHPCGVKKRDRVWAECPTKEIADIVLRALNEWDVRRQMERSRT